MRAVVPFSFAILGSYAQSIPENVWMTLQAGGLNDVANTVLGEYEKSVRTVYGLPVYMRKGGGPSLYSSSSTAAGGAVWIIGNDVSVGTDVGFLHSEPHGGSTDPSTVSSWQVLPSTTEQPVTGANGTAWISLDTFQVRSQGQSSAPAELWVSVPFEPAQQPHRVGLFTITANYENGAPVWEQQNGQQFIWSSPDGSWVIGEASDRTAVAGGLRTLSSHRGILWPSDTQPSDWGFAQDAVFASAPLLDLPMWTAGANTLVSRQTLWRSPLPNYLYLTAGNDRYAQWEGLYGLVNRAGSAGMPLWRREAADGAPEATIKSANSGKWMIQIDGLVDLCESVGYHTGLLLPDEPQGQGQTWQCSREGGSTYDVGAEISVNNYRVTPAPPGATPVPPWTPPPPTPQPTPTPPQLYSVQQVLSAAEAAGNTMVGRAIGGSGRTVLKVEILSGVDSRVHVTATISGELAGFGETQQADFAVLASSAFGVRPDQLEDLMFMQSDTFKSTFTVTPAMVQPDQSVFAAALERAAHQRRGGSTMPVYALPAMLFMVGVPSLFVTFFAYTSGSLSQPGCTEAVNKYHRGLQCLCDTLWTLHLCLDPFNVMNYFDLSSLLGGFALTSSVLSIGAWIVRLIMAACTSNSKKRDDFTHMTGVSTDGGQENEDEYGDYEHDKWVEGDCRWIALMFPFAAVCGALCAPGAWVFSSIRTGAQGLLTHALVAAMPGICYALIANDHLYYQSTISAAQACIGLMTVIIGVPFSVSMLCVKPNRVMSDALAGQAPRLERGWSDNGYRSVKGEMDPQDDGRTEQTDWKDEDDGASDMTHGQRDPGSARGPHGSHAYGTRAGAESLTTWGDGAQSEARTFATTDDGCSSVPPSGAGEGVPHAPPPRQSQFRP